MKPKLLARLRPYCRVLPILAMCVVSLGATSQSCKLADDAKNKNDFSDFVVSLELQDSSGTLQTTFDQQDSIHFVLTVKNNGTKKKTLDLPVNDQANFAVITDDRSETVKWVASSSTTSTTNTVEVDFDPGQARNYTLDATPVDSEGKFLLKGDYQAVGALMVNFDNFATDPLAKNDLASDPLPFTID